MVKHLMIRTILSLVVSNNWQLHQLDVGNAFLHVFLLEEVYMQQPLGSVDLVHPNHVYHLHKAVDVDLGGV